MWNLCLGSRLRVSVKFKASLSNISGQSPVRNTCTKDEMNQLFIQIRVSKLLYHCSLNRSMYDYISYFSEILAMALPSYGLSLKPLAVGVRYHDV